MARNRQSIMDGDHENSYCDWYTIDVQSDLESTVEILSDSAIKEGRKLKKYYIDDNDSTQVVEVQYIGIINVYEVEIDPFSEGRLDRARQWVNEKTIGRLFFSIDED